MGIMKHITKEDAVDVVNGDEIVEENAKKYGKVLKVKKRNIINKLNEKLSTIRVSPQRNE
jgi:bisphosphoglycerate-dependent phosphoglycerate mutase